MKLSEFIKELQSIQSEIEQSSELDTDSLRFFCNHDGNFINLKVISVASDYSMLGDRARGADVYFGIDDKAWLYRYEIRER